MLKILSAPNSVLSQKAKEVKKIDKSLLKFLKEMEEALMLAKDPIGVGLAAPQVGRALQIFIAKPTPKSKISVFINPKVTALLTSNKQQLTANKTLEVSGHRSEVTKLEGCLSLLNIWGEVKRAPTIKIAYLNQNGKEYSREFNGFMGTIIQHEMDHLQGVLFPKRVLEQNGVLYKSHKNEKGEDEFEKIEI